MQSAAIFISGASLATGDRGFAWLAVEYNRKLSSLLRVVFTFLLALCEPV
jgi:hypothetical protein